MPRYLWFDKLTTSGEKLSAVTFLCSVRPADVRLLITNGEFPVSVRHFDELSQRFEHFGFAQHRPVECQKRVRLGVDLKCE
jgi:hypothetical protein